MALAALNKSNGTQAVRVVNLPIDLVVARDTAQAVKQALGLIGTWPLRCFPGRPTIVGHLVCLHATYQMPVALVLEKGEHPGPPAVERVRCQPDGRILLGANRLAGAVSERVPHQRPSGRPKDTAQPPT